jgi:hypothetical protein
MRTYLKIFSITVGIQIFGFLICYLLDSIFKIKSSSTMFPLHIGIFFILISMILGIILPICWCDTLLKKIIIILLLPTNYTPLLCILFVIKFITNIGNILNNLPINFG